MLGPPAAWGGQFAVDYFLVTIECQRGLVALDVWLALVAVLAILVDAGAGLAGYTAWRQSRGPADSDLAGAPGRSAAMGALGVAMSALFAFAIVLTGLSWIIIPTCQ